MPTGLNDVVITGCGLVSPLGLEPGLVHARLCEGASASAPITAFDPTPFPARYACAISGFQGKDWVENRKNLKLMTPAVQYGLAAIRLAAQSGGLVPGVVAPDRLGMFVGGPAPRSARWAISCPRWRRRWSTVDTTPVVSRRTACRS
jgi:3-oxoacyl-(acyl-carrier-protein) synthase